MGTHIQRVGPGLPAAHGVGVMDGADDRTRTETGLYDPEQVVWSGRIKTDAGAVAAVNTPRGEVVVPKPSGGTRIVPVVAEPGKVQPEINIDGVVQRWVFAGSVRLALS